jgi:RNA polymerase subunit RPABC4/transcription elongation factor Spt4
MEAVIARGVQVLAALGGAYLVALWFVLVVWTFRDIETRSRSVITQIFSTLLVVLFFVPGVLLYLILRPKETLDVAFQRSLEEEYLLQDLEELPLCRNCQHYVEDDFMLCPHCQTQLREPCVACSRLVDLRWNVCPYCSAEQSRVAEESSVRVPVPAARWVAPAALQRRALKQIPTGNPASLTTGDDPAVRPVAAAATSQAVAPPAPVRLFDRRKTRESARLNGYQRPVAVNGNGTVTSPASLVDQFGRKLDPGESVANSNGNAPTNGAITNESVSEEATVSSAAVDHVPVSSDKVGD